MQLSGLLLLGVAVGGALGAVLRCVLMVSLSFGFPSVFPWGTVFVNGVGSLAIGLAVASLSHIAGDSVLRFALIPGFLGGFTTFSAFSLETLVLLQAERWGLAVLNVFGSVGLGLVCVAMGLKLGMWLSRF